MILPKTKIALLNSPYLLNEPFYQHMPPLALLYLASYMEQCNFDPMIFNIESCVNDNGIYIWNYDIKVLFAQLRTFDPDVIAITCPYSGRWPFTQRLLHIIKNNFENVIIILDGIHPTSFPEYCLRSSAADFIVLGEGELSSVELINHIFTDKNYSDIDGIAYKNNSDVIVNPKTIFIDDLDSLPFPAYHLIDIKRYEHLCRNDRMSQIKGFYFWLLTSRSCPNQCTYCNMFLSHGRKWRPRSPDNVLKEIEYLVSSYNIRQFAIIDDNFTLQRDRAEQILEGIINRKLNISFTTPNGLSAKTLDDNLIKLLKQAGALGISLAIESGSEYMRNEIYNKRLSSEQIINSIDLCKKHKLPVHAFFMVGAPQETEETINSSICMMKRIKIPSHINIATPYKGTEFYDYYIQNDIISDEIISHGTTIDLRVPPENIKNYKQILRWRSKLQFFNILFALKAIITDKTFLNFNTFVRFIKGIILPKKINYMSYNNILDKYLPLNYHGK